MFPRPSRYLVTCAAIMITKLAGGASMAATALDCLPPIPPAPATDASTRADYHSEIGQEYTAYFDEAQAYLRCLDAARTAVTEEINRAIVDYRALGPEPDG